MAHQRRRRLIGRKSTESGFVSIIRRSDPPHHHPSSSHTLIRTMLEANGILCVLRYNIKFTCQLKSVHRIYEICVIMKYHQMNFILFFTFYKMKQSFCACNHAYFIALNMHLNVSQEIPLVSS